MRPAPRASILPGPPSVLRNCSRKHEELGLADLPGRFILSCSPHTAHDHELCQWTLPQCPGLSYPVINLTECVTGMPKGHPYKKTITPPRHSILGDSMQTKSKCLGNGGDCYLETHLYTDCLAFPLSPTPQIPSLWLGSTDPDSRHRSEVIPQVPTLGFLRNNRCSHLRTYHVCHSGSGLPHSGGSFLVPTICLQIS